MVDESVNRNINDFQIDPLNSYRSGVSLVKTFWSVDRMLLKELFWSMRLEESE